MAYILVDICSPSLRELMHSWTQSQWRATMQVLFELREILLRPDSTIYLHDSPLHAQMKGPCFSSRALVFSDSFSDVLSTLEACAVIAPIREFLHRCATGKCGDSIDSSKVRSVL
jgi:hypothetical protein